MQIKFTIRGLEETDELVSKIVKAIKSEIIDNSLDSPLGMDLNDLKSRLLKAIVTELRSPVTIQTPDIKEEKIEVKKSDQEMIKHITGVDVANLQKTKDYSTLADGKLVIVSKKGPDKTAVDNSLGPKPSKRSSGVNLRLPMSPADTFENQYAQALDYFNKSVFAIADNNGNMDYYMNPGIDLTQYVKVVCSTEVGDTEKAHKRWDNTASKRGFADWTLLKSGLDIVKDRFIKLNNVVDKMKEGDYDSATETLSKLSSKSTATTNIAEKIDNLKKGDKLSPTVDSYNNSVKLVKNLKLEKSVKKDRTFYTLVSKYDEASKEYHNFEQKLKQEVRMMKLTKQQKYVSTLVKSINNKLRRK